MTLSSPVVFSSVLVAIGEAPLVRALPEFAKRKETKRPQTLRLAAFAVPAKKMDRLGNSDLARLYLLRFRQSQSDDALLNLRADLAGIDRRIELEGAAEIFRARFPMDERTFNGRHGASPQNRKLIILDPHLEVFLAHAGHFDFERVAIRIFQDGGRRRDELLCGLALTVSAIFTD